ncbi:hypothetical protein CDL12_22984 [Handroanthus impetiginosus]|uniref:DUF4218 domain-containing protein n=1 Tax=Handroanthus impetiginosus TaxID=429701 RepID=A0A2G9GGS3_9LAMI|nr:hypothetical protein CDL12_22984 [Handroanthus impetiginosus]
MINNKARAEGSICEIYLIQEVGYFASYYFEPDAFTYQNPHTRSVFNQSGRPAGKCTTRYLNDAEFNAAKLHVLINCDEVQDFVR